jgi:hypothetical protein
MPKSVHFLALFVATASYVAFSTLQLSAQSSSPQRQRTTYAPPARRTYKLCANVPAGGGRIMACLKQQQDRYAVDQQSPIGFVATVAVHDKIGKSTTGLAPNSTWGVPIKSGAY